MVDYTIQLHYIYTINGLFTKLFFLSATNSTFPTFYVFISFFKNILFIYSRETQREAETQAEGEAGSTQGA